MAIDLPIGAPLTDAQGELTAKVGSMKSLLALPSIRKRNIPKANQMSAFDYLLKVLDAMGLSPEVVFNAFLTKIFDEAGNLEGKVLDAIADSIGEQGRQLSPFINNPAATKDQKKAYKASNKSYIKGLFPSATFLQTVKQKIAKDLMVMIFGPAKANATSLNTSQAEVDTLISNSICGEGLFSLSNAPLVRNQDIEYNRIKLKKQLEAGEVIFEITCQDVKIKLPENPGFMFTGGGSFTSPGSAPPSPSQSLMFSVQYVNNQVQRINNESNANKGGKKFLQILIEKLLSFISILVQPYLPNLFTAINATLPLSEHVNQGDFVFDNCAIANNPEDEKTKAFATSLFNALMKDLIKLLLLFAIKKFKQLVANYFARTALEKQKRKLEKAKAKFKIFSAVADNADKIKKYQAALSTLSSVLGSVS